MTRIILHGCNGHMGKIVSSTALEESGVKIVAGVDIDTTVNYDFPVCSSMKEVSADSADVVVDFSVAKAVDEVIDYAAETGIPTVICTTGLTETQLKRIDEVSKTAPILRSANMALGVNLLFKLAADAAKILSAKGYDIEIVEKHHRRKLDAPSGTALAIADAINAACDDKFTYCYGRSERHAPRDAAEIGISAVRGGTIPGDHDVIFAGEDEVITLSHTAYSRKIWAKGALSAAAFLAGKPAGYYTMMDVIGDALA
ncbi:MAG: 4-hydroxy-tetrahydrodipicolinate reductase [Stomatobaculum sp.]|nr:4-hydroxy-tetrahydrodipicolinate reductase [Stomatobaculum sp.]